MIIAYVAWPPDNGTYMWADPKTQGQPPPGVICQTCHQRIDYDAINLNYKPPRSYYDLCRTYDGSFLVSPRLRQFLEQRKLPCVSFGEIPSSHRYFVLHCANILRLVRPPTLRTEEYCEKCEQYRSVYGIKREQLQDVREPIREGIFFSDLRVGYFPQMGPELIVGMETWNSMLALKLKGLGNGEPIECGDQ